MHSRIIKLGGSLLDLPDLADRLRDWLRNQPDAINVLIVGGGPMVDAIREADRIHQLGDQAAHELALEVMTLTAKLIQAILPEAKLTNDYRPIEYTETSLQILDVRQLLSEFPLPASWDVTSDSIAAHTASILNASELVLLKSTLPTSANSIESFVGEEFVDRYFYEVAKDLTIRIVNLRDANFAQRIIPPAASSGIPLS